MTTDPTLEGTTPGISRPITDPDLLARIGIRGFHEVRVTDIQDTHDVAECFCVGDKVCEYHKALGRLAEAEAENERFKLRMTTDELRYAAIVDAETLIGELTAALEECEDELAQRTDLAPAYLMRARVALRKAQEYRERGAAPVPTRPDPGRPERWPGDRSGA